MRSWGLLCGLWLGMTAAVVQAAPPVTAVSPDGRVRIEFSLSPAATPQFRVLFGDDPVVADSPLGIALDDGTSLGGPCRVLSTETRAVREDFTQVTGKRSLVRVRAQEATVRLEEQSEPHRRWDVVLRADDDGAAFRYGFPAQDGWDELVIRQELTQFHVAPDATACALPLNGYTTSYEKPYSRQPVGKLPADWLLGLPLLLELPGGHWAAVTESNIHEYAGLYLQPAGEGRLSARLSPRPNEEGVAVRQALPHQSPWRVIMVGDDVSRLVESDLVLKLAEPCRIEDTSWIKTGKTTFPWWNAYYEEGVDFTPGLNTATAKHYIDFCAEAGFEFHSLDGVDNTAWYGGPIVPYRGAAPVRGVDGLDLQEVLAYARSRGVGMRLWMNWKAARDHMETAFPQYREWGVTGVMLDFMDRDDQEMNRFLRQAVALAAENRLTVTLHGCPKPTGLERTYPNLLTHEGVMNLEYNKWDPVGITPEHELIVPFTRMLAGPLDFHQGSFRAVAPEAYRPRKAAPLVIGTPARTLASYVVYQNHLSMVADYPSAYRSHPGLPVLAAIPTTWDDTRVLSAAVGEYVVIARRRGDDWHIGAMTNGQPRLIDVPLSFGGAKRLTADVWEDDGTADRGLAHRQVAVAGEPSLTLNLAAAGGAYVKLTTGE